MKKRVRIAISLVLLLGTLMANLAIAQAGEIQPRLAGVSTLSSALEISSKGAATCKGKVILQSGYTAEVEVELQRDGTTIKTWADSGSGTLSVGGVYYVVSGHDYVVSTFAMVYDKDGRLVSSGSKDSVEWSY